MSGNYNRGPKIFADNAALAIGTPDYVGQLACTLDGVSFAFSRDLISGGFIEDVVCQNNRVYFFNLNCTTLFTSNRIVAISTIAAGVHAFATSAGSANDNVMFLQNLSNTGYSALNFYNLNDNIPGRATIGLGNPGTAYPNQAFWETNYPPAGATTVAAPDIFISAFYKTGAGAALSHKRAYFDNTNKITYFPGWDDTTPQPATGMFVNADGSVSFYNEIKSTGKTVANLRAAATAGVGARDFVTDATGTMAANIGAIVTGGGANKVPVYCDATNWRIG